MPGTTHLVPDSTILLVLQPNEAALLRDTLVTALCSGPGPEHADVEVTYGMCLYLNDSLPRGWQIEIRPLHRLTAAATEAAA